MYMIPFVWPGVR